MGWHEHIFNHKQTFNHFMLHYRCHPWVDFLMAPHHLSPWYVVASSSFVTLSIWAMRLPLTHSQKQHCQQSNYHSRQENVARMSFFWCLVQANGMRECSCHMFNALQVLFAGRLLSLNAHTLMESTVCGLSAKYAECIPGIYWSYKLALPHNSGI